MEGEGVQQMFITKFKFVPPPLIDVVFRQARWNCRCKKVLLTIDDSPSPGTPRILDLLDQFEIRAAFFVNVPEDEKMKEMVREIDARGHLVCNHGMKHVKLNKLTPEMKAVQIVTSKEQLEEMLGKEVKFFRPPYGAFDLEIYNMVLESGQTLVMWTLLTGDFLGDEKLAISNVKKYLSRDSIVVMHDNAKSREVFAPTLEALVKTVSKNEFILGEPEECLN